MTLAILAGGQSRRMGQPKGELRLRNQPILQFILQSISWTGPTLLITTPGREHPPGCEFFDGEATDAVAQGPLGGILTALQNCSTPNLIVATVDMPGVGMTQLQWLANRLAEKSDLLGVMCRRAIEGRMQIEPFPFACRRDAINIIAARLNDGERSVRSLMDLPEFAADTAPKEWPAQVWTNLNTPDDYEAFVAELQV